MTSILTPDHFQAKSFYLYPSSVVATQTSDGNVVFISLCGHLHPSMTYINHVKMAL